MLQAGDWIVIAVLVLVCALALGSMIHDRKKGCLKNCGGCSLQDLCHDPHRLKQQWDQDHPKS